MVQREQLVCSVSQALAFIRQLHSRWRIHARWRAVARVWFCLHQSHKPNAMHFFDWILYWLFMNDAASHWDTEWEGFVALCRGVTVLFLHVWQQRPVRSSSNTAEAQQGEGNANTSPVFYAGARMLLILWMRHPSPFSQRGGSFLQ